MPHYCAFCVCVFGGRVYTLGARGAMGAYMHIYICVFVNITSAGAVDREFFSI